MLAFISDQKTHRSFFSLRIGQPFLSIVVASFYTLLIGFVGVVGLDGGGMFLESIATKLFSFLPT